MNRDFLIVIAGRFIAALIGVISIRIATTFLSPAQYGELAILVAIQMFCGLLLINPMGQHINRHTHQWWDDGTLLIRLLFYSRYVLFIAVIGASATFFIAPQITITQTLFSVFAIFIFVIAVTWNTTSLPMLNMLGFRSISVMWTAASSLASLLISLALVSWAPSASMWLFGQACGLAIGAIGARGILRKHISQDSSNSGDYSLFNRGVLIKYCLPLSVATGLMWLQISGYRFIVREYWGIEMLGFAAVGLLLAGQLFSLIEVLSQQFLLPMFYRLISNADLEGQRSAMSDLLNFMGPLYLVLAGLIFLSAPYLLKILTSAQYADAEIFIRFGVGIECCRVLANLLGQAAQITKVTRSLVLPYAAGAISLISLMILAGEYGENIIWVGVVLLLSSLCALCCMVLAMHKQVNLTLDASRWLFSLFTMIVLCIPIWWLRGPQSWFETISALVFISLVGGAILAKMIFKNSALQRMMMVKLQQESR